MYSTGLNSRKLASKFRLVIHNNSLWTLLKLDRGGGRDGGGEGPVVRLPSRQSRLCNALHCLTECRTDIGTKDVRAKPYLESLNCVNSVRLGFICFQASTDYFVPSVHVYICIYVSVCLFGKTGSPPSEHCSMYIYGLLSGLGKLTSVSFVQLSVRRGAKPFTQLLTHCMGWGCR